MVWRGRGVAGVVGGAVARNGISRGCGAGAHALEALDAGVEGAAGGDLLMRRRWGSVVECLSEGVVVVGVGRGVDVGMAAGAAARGRMMGVFVEGEACVQ